MKPKTLFVILGAAFVVISCATTSSQEYEVRRFTRFSRSELIALRKHCRPTCERRWEESNLTIYQDGNPAGSIAKVSGAGNFSTKDINGLLKSLDAAKANGGALTERKGPLEMVCTANECAFNFYFNVKTEAQPDIQAAVLQALIRGMVK